MDNKGFTLVELLVTLAMLGLIMMVTIPNIEGISEANKKQAYADDALRFKNTVEYMIRSDENYKKPTNNGDCIIVSLSHLVVDSNNNISVEGSEYDNAPNDGQYAYDYSYVVVRNDNKKLKYYVQLVEQYGSSPYNYGGVKIVDYLKLEGSKYMSSSDVMTSASLSDFKAISAWSHVNRIKTVCSCSTIKGLYYGNNYKTS